MSATDAHTDALLAPALLTGSTGIGYVLYRQWVQAGQTPP